jgi:magnesium chelatase subunit H
MSQDQYENDAQVMRLYEQLVEVEQRLIPTGLHVFGRASELAEKADLLKMVASFDRPEQGTRALQNLIAEGLGIRDYEALLHETPVSETRELVDSITSESVQTFCRDGVDAAVGWLTNRAEVSADEALPVFRLLEKIAQQLDSNHEVEALLRALRGEYIEPGPGADIIQNPQVLPTGRNTHAVNPYSVPLS